MTWRPGEPIVCDCGAVWRRNTFGVLAHPAPWCERRREQAREQGTEGHKTAVESARIREGLTYASQKPSTYRRRKARR